MHGSLILLARTAQERHLMLLARMTLERQQDELRHVCKISLPLGRHARVGAMEGTS